MKAPFICCNCRWRQLRIIFVVLSSLSIGASVFIVVRLHCNGRRLLSSGTRSAPLMADGRPVSPDQSRQETEREHPLLCMFTTFKPVAFKMQIYENVLHNWMLLADPGRIKPILYVTPDNRKQFHDVSQTTAASDADDNEFSAVNRSLVALARRLGWTVVDAPRVSPNGVPYFKEMFASTAARFGDCVFYGYSNGDILFGSGLVRTLLAVKEVLESLGRTLIIGRRTNLQFPDDGPAPILRRTPDVERAARAAGRLFVSNAQDYFLLAAADQFPWHRVPDVVVGRPAYDNFVVATAIRDGVSVIDATASVLAVHQSDRDGNYAGHNNTDRNANVAVIGRYFGYRRGFTTRSQYVTMGKRVAGGQTISSTSGSAVVAGGTSANSSSPRHSPSPVSGIAVTVHTRQRRRRVHPPLWRQLLKYLCSG